MTIKSSSLKPVFILFALSCVFFIIGNGTLSLTNPDEVFYAQTAKEMCQQHSWLTPYLFGSPQFEKPIFLYWLLRISFFIFGMSAFAARFFPALFALIGVIAVYFAADLWFKSREKGFLSGLILMSSGLYVGLARTVFTDMIFSVFILLSLSSFFWGYFRREKKHPAIILFFIFAGLAVLTKGPLGILIPGLIVILFLSIRKELKYLFCRASLWGLLIFILISLPWYVFMITKYSTSFVREFFYNDHFRRIIQAEHPGNDRWYFYPLAIAGSVVPWSLYVIAALIFNLRRFNPKIHPARLFLLLWIAVVFLVFQGAHSKLVSYIFPLFPALVILTADFICDSLENKSRPLFLISLGTSVLFLLIPIGIFIASKKYPDYISKASVSYVLISLVVLLGIVFLRSVLRGKLLPAVYTLVLFVPLLIFPMSFFSSNIEPYVSSRDICVYLSKNYPVNGRILCSKPFVRGVSYYTGQEVAVIGVGAGNFFSPHPVPFLDTDSAVCDFLRTQPVTYCVLRKSSVQDIMRAIKGLDFTFTALKVIGNAYLVKIELLHKTA